MNRTLCAALSALLLGSLSACQSAAPMGPKHADLREVRATVDALYAAFDFEAEGEADWATMSALFLPGACFVAPISPGRRPEGVDQERFLADFQGWVRTGEYRRTGLHERILHRRIDRFGSVAHAWVSFEGVIPGTGEVRTRGLDSLQLVLDGQDWKLTSFTTQYASPSAPLPERFLAPLGAEE